MFSGEGAARLANRFLLSQQSGYRFIRRECAVERRVTSGFSARHRNRGGDAVLGLWGLEAPKEQPEGEKDDLERGDGKSKRGPVAPHGRVENTEPAANAAEKHQSVADQTNYGDHPWNESVPEQHPGKERSTQPEHR